MYILITRVEGYDDEYYAFDSCTGETYFTSLFNRARFFTSKDDIKELLESDEFKKESLMSDGTLCPPIMIHSACHLSGYRLKGSAKLIIAEILISESDSIPVQGEIKEPKGYIYE